MSEKTIILAHGLWMTGFEMAVLKRRLRAAGFHVVQFRYRMVTRPLEHNTAKLAAFIRKHARQETYLIGHSLGGVLSLQTLHEYPDLPIEKVICLGSPLVDTHAGRRFMRFAPGRAMLGKTLPEAIFDKPLVAWSGRQSVGVIAGSRSLGLGRFVAAIPRPNDGMVGVSETCLPGIDDHLTIAVTHTGLLVSAETAEQCIHFVRHGMFLH